jgi:DNA-binding PadR family transcriptional regulator
MYRKVITRFIDILALKELERESTIGGYDLVTIIYREFGILVSTGTTYSTLYSLERKGLIKGRKSKGKTIYKLTDEGEEVLRTIKKAKKEFQRLTARIF